MHEWTEDLAIGVETIDSQHREMFHAFNEMTRGPGKTLPEEIPQMLGFLEDYVVNHFGMEELYMRRYSYPGYPDHKNEHVKFINLFYDLRDEIDARGVGPETAGKMGDALGEWLVDHIGKTDRALGEFIRKQGRKQP